MVGLMVFFFASFEINFQIYYSFNNKLIELNFHEFFFLFFKIIFPNVEIDLIKLLIEFQYLGNKCCCRIDRMIWGIRFKILYSTANRYASLKLTTTVRREFYAEK